MRDPAFGKALNRFQKEDPTFRVHVDGDSGQTIISGMGELHLEVYVERMRREYKVESETGRPQVNYREAITQPAEFDYLHKKQSGGAGQFGEDAIEDPEPAPAHEPVIDRLVRTIPLGSIPPHQAMLDDINDARDNPTVVHPWNAMRQRKKRLDPAHLRLVQQEWNIHNQRLLDADFESTNHRLRKHFNGS